MKKNENIVNHKIFTQQELLDLATDRSGERGMTLYDLDSVVRVEIHPDSVEAIVHGSSNRRYKTRVAWSYEYKKWTFNCSCPYDFGGICKHEIALGLWMIDNCVNQSEKSENKAAIEKSELDLLIEKANSETIFSFLREALDNDKNLYERFKSIVDNVETAPLEIPFAEIVKKIEKRFLSIELTPEDEINDNIYMYDNRDYYRDTWEIEEDLYKEEISDDISDIFDDVETLIDDGVILQAVQQYCLIVEAFCNCDEEEDLPGMHGYESYEIYGLIADYIEERLNDIVNKFTNISFSTKVIEELFEFIKQRYLTLEYSSLPAHLSKLSLVIEWNKKQAEEFLQIIRNRSNNSATKLQYYLSELIGNEEVKTLVCEDTVKLFRPAAEYLLKKYSDEPKEYSRIAEAIMTARFAESLLPDVLEKLNPDSNKELYRKAATELYKLTGEQEYYRLIKKYSSCFDYKEFIDLISSSLDSRRLFEIYVEEKEYEKAYELFTDKLRGSFEEDDYLKMLINHLPVKCCGYITTEVNRLLHVAGTRDKYYKAGKLLAVIKVIKDDALRKKGIDFINSICLKYKMRPAMLDEFRSLGLR